MNLSDNQITEIFFHLDEFQIEFESMLQKKGITANKEPNYKARKPIMSYSEVMTIKWLFSTFRAPDALNITTLIMFSVIWPICFLKPSPVTDL